MISANAGRPSGKNRIFCPLVLQEFWGKVWNRANISLPFFPIFIPASWNIEIWEAVDGFMSVFVSVEIGRRRRQRAISEARTYLDCAADRLHDAVLSLDLHYATQEPEWQEGPEGALDVQVSHALREAVQKLRVFELPEVGELG